MTPAARAGVWQGESGVLARRVAAYIDAALASGTTESFDRLALDMHDWQVRHDPVLAKLAHGQPADWRAIPAVPVDLFKYVRVGTVTEEEEPAAEFLTSGTTGGGRGSHRLRSTWLYDRGAVGWARACNPGAPGNIAALLDDPTTAPESSLSHMVALFASWTQPRGQVSWHTRGGRLDVHGLNQRIRTGGALFVATTAFALAEWLDGPHVRLAPGSVLMVTGGFKGRIHRLDGDELYTAADELLAPARIVTEYGMTELSSQLWGTPTTSYRPPPWLRVLATDPHTGQPRPNGQAGQLRFVDLANLDSTLAIDTLDEGTVHEDGTVSLSGRLRGAPARGCSLTVEESWEARL